MSNLQILCWRVVLLCFACSVCFPAEGYCAGGRLSVLFVLAGDSTVTDESGWGAGFRDLLTEQASCTNLARSGRSSRSFRTEGWWDRCLECRPRVILIQFGHNDQPGKGPERESAADGAYREHLRRYVAEAREVGALPVLVTPLTRRRWSAGGRIEPTLAEYAAAVQAVAAETQAPLIDLHAASIRQCEQIGVEAFRAFEPMLPTGADHTHLNAAGGRAVAALVVDQLRSVLPQYAECFDGERLVQFQEPQQWQRKQRSGDLLLEADERVISVRQRERLVLAYNMVAPALPEGLDPKLQRSGFLHPVVSPAGSVVTAAYPADHAHQNGIFAAWTKASWNERSLNFWDLAAGTGRVLHSRVLSTAASAAGVSFEVELVHRAEQQPVVDILRERWRVLVRSSDDACHDFEIASVQQNQTTLPLQLLQYHYGGFAVRGPVEWLLPKDADQESLNAESGAGANILNDAGSVREAANHQHSRWVAMTGMQGGQPVTIVMLCHGDNFRAPQAVRVHPTKPYFVFSPAVDGDFVIEAGKPFESRYRFLVLDGLPDSERINAVWNSWNADAVTSP